MERMETYYTLQEVAETLKLSKRTIYRYLETGELQGHKAGRQWRIPEKALKAFIVRPNKPGVQPHEGAPDVV